MRLWSPVMRLRSSGPKHRLPVNWLGAEENALADLADTAALSDDLDWEALYADAE